MPEERHLKIKFSPYAVYGIFSAAIILTSFLLSFFVVPEGAFIILKGEIGNRYSLVNLSFVALTICSINVAAAWSIYKKDRVASHVLGALAVFVSAIVLLKIAAIIFSL